jgi:uncharacterized protein (TIGR03086 family)
MVVVVQRLEALVDALDMQVGVGGQVQSSQLSLASPCPGWTVRDVMGHSIGVTLTFTEFAAGTTDAPHAPTGDLVGRDHRQALRTAARAAQRAWTGADMGRTCRLSFGTFSADSVLAINLVDVLAHSWDIAVATGVSLDCDESLWTAGLDAADVVIGHDRDTRQYGPQIPVGASATARQRFLGFVGRLDPHVSRQHVPSPWPIKADRPAGGEAP